jgi:uncharacterized damage-inducible protein DinB
LNTITSPIKICGSSLITIPIKLPKNPSDYLVTFSMRIIFGINQTQKSYSVWEVHPIANCLNLDKANYASTLLILETLDLNATIHYKTTTGLAFHNTIRDTLFHIINHSTYHRGQIAMDFRQHGLEPLATDYIFYKR